MNFDLLHACKRSQIIDLVVIFASPRRLKSITAYVSGTARIKTSRTQGVGYITFLLLFFSGTPHVFPIQAIQSDAEIDCEHNIVKPNENYVEINKKGLHSRATLIFPRRLEQVHDTDLSFRPNG